MTPIGNIQLAVSGLAVGIHPEQPMNIRDDNGPSRKMGESEGMVSRLLSQVVLSGRQGAAASSL
jgi:hypothetical protein